MKTSSDWKPSKFIKDKNGRLIASRDKQEVYPASRFLADLTATWYDKNLKKYARGRLLDLGCGQAPLYGVYAPLVDDVVLADWEKSQYTNKQVDVRCDITKPLSFED